MAGHRLDGLKARRLLGGYDITGLAKIANVSDQLIKVLENGGSCRPHESARILNALIPAISLTSATAATPTVFTKVGHGLQTGDVVTLAGVSAMTPDVNGVQTVTRINTSTFSIAVDTSGGDPGTGGTATPTAASLTQAAL